MTIHHHFRIGQKVFVILKDGRKFHDRYEGRTSLCPLTEHRRVSWKDIRSVTIYKQGE